MLENVHLEQRQPLPNTIWFNAEFVTLLNRTWRIYYYSVRQTVAREHNTFPVSPRLQRRLRCLCNAESLAIVGLLSFLYHYQIIFFTTVVSLAGPEEAVAECSWCSICLVIFIISATVYDRWWRDSAPAGSILVRCDSPTRHRDCSV